MAGEKLMTVSVQLPASELGRLSALMDLVLRAMEGNSGTRQDMTALPTAVEGSGNEAFDPAQFEALRKAAGPAQPEEAPERPDQTRGSAEEPERGLPVQRSSAPPQYTADAPEDRAVPALRETAARALGETASTRSPDTAEASLSDVVEADAVPVDIGPKGWGSPETVRSEEMRQDAAPPLRQEAVWRDGVGTPSVGFPVSDTAGPLPAKRFGGEERLVAAGPAPLTAQAVSLAFQRDDRRYDNGFPLY